jgi:hypothetical protein
MSRHKFVCVRSLGECVTVASCRQLRPVILSLPWQTLLVCHGISGLRCIPRNIVKEPGPSNKPPPVNPNERI